MSSTFIKFKVGDEIQPIDGSGTVHWTVIEVPQGNSYSLERSKPSGLGKNWDTKVSSVKFIDYAYELVKRF